MISICIPVSLWLNQRTELVDFCSVAIFNIFRCSIPRPVRIRSDLRNQWLVDCARGGEIATNSDTLLQGIGETIKNNRCEDKLTLDISAVGQQ